MYSQLFKDDGELAGVDLIFAAVPHGWLRVSTNDVSKPGETHQYRRKVCITICHLATNANAISERGLFHVCHRRWVPHHWHYSEWFIVWGKRYHASGQWACFYSSIKIRNRTLPKTSFLFWFLLGTHVVHNAPGASRSTMILAQLTWKQMLGQRCAFDHECEGRKIDRQPVLVAAY